MSEKKHWNLMSRYVSNELSLEETEELIVWLGDDPLRSQLLKEFQETWERTKNFPETFKVDSGIAWQKLKNEIEGEEVSADFPDSRLIKWILISVVICLMIVALAILILMFA